MSTNHVLVGEYTGNAVIKELLVILLWKIFPNLVSTACVTFYLLVLTKCCTSSTYEYFCISRKWRFKEIRVCQWPKEIKSLKTEESGLDQSVLSPEFSQEQISRGEKGQEIHPSHPSPNQESVSELIPQGAQIPELQVRLGSGGTGEDHKLLGMKQNWKKSMFNIPAWVRSTGTPFPFPVCFYGLTESVCPDLCDCLIEMRAFLFSNLCKEVNFLTCIPEPFLVSFRIWGYQNVL